ncbi:hypothetical protein BaRGS_00034317 [Batillaria attramentaria]|uniref:Uncharacterized protein n=1 Tax=Batillaria attramentaria TaxID=370345 RepID=A0ABD0JHX4_9CAEN
MLKEQLYVLTSNSTGTAITEQAEAVGGFMALCLIYLNVIQWHKAKVISLVWSRVNCNPNSKPWLKLQAWRFTPDFPSHFPAVCQLEETDGLESVKWTGDHHTSDFPLSGIS